MSTVLAVIAILPLIAGIAALGHIAINLANRLEYAKLQLQRAETDVMRPVQPPLLPEDGARILVLARVAIADADIFDEAAVRFGMRDAEMIELRERIQAATEAANQQELENTHG